MASLSPPPTRWIKVNCDAAVGNSIAGLGVVVRDCLGRPLMVAGKRMFSVAADMMEVQAILLAFDLLRGSLPQYRAVEIQSDSMMALQVARDMVNNPNGEGVLAITLQYVRDMEALRFSHILREGNGPAN
ncbi:hypothetical protein HPP92_021906 [Vanilla planifolia]|uniref:RNase H type-1 domain-containing protein n=1 Tax=Vanilla planifolia TaxID=51239 RepID=A0A835PX70_VANPL|nr:hypothetical protein HPP92_021906 [Vanilla planifolia]